MKNGLTKIFAQISLMLDDKYHLNKLIINCINKLSIKIHGTLKSRFLLVIKSCAISILFCSTAKNNGVL